ncbi:hypothetical protein BGZ93_005411 [Podila epicladia]|nr:hypothetical protein BGZ93_005411 [Podila epicladia]
MLLNEIKRLTRAGILPRGSNGFDRRQILDTLQFDHQKISAWDDQNIGSHILNGVNNLWDYPGPRLFIVLPSDLEEWVDSDPTTHQFRLYFMCDISELDHIQDAKSQYVHFLNHPGYNLRRTQEFFVEFGEYVLQVLRMLQRGHVDDKYVVPPLGTDEILWSPDSAITSSRFFKGSIEVLVRKAIGYLEGLSRTKWNDPALARSQSVAVKAFLDVKHESGDNKEGDLHRYINDDQHVFWRCRAHLHRLGDHKPMAALKKFVWARGGAVNMQQATIEVSLRSKGDADKFLLLLTGVQHIFDISIKLSWQATRPEVIKLCIGIAQTKTVVLAVDGITLDIHPQDRVQYMEDLFADLIIPYANLQLISLLNYPRHQEQFIYTGCCSFLQKPKSERPSYDWVDLQGSLKKFLKSVADGRTISDGIAAALELESAFASHGIRDVQLINMYNGPWKGVFNLDMFTLVEITSSGMFGPRAMVSLGTLRKLTLDLIDIEFDSEFYYMVQVNAGLQELNITYQEHNVLSHIRHLLLTRPKSFSLLRITFFERIENTHGRVAVRLVVRGHGVDPRSETLTVKNQTQDLLQEIDCVQWCCDHNPRIRSDVSAFLLDRFTQQHPSVLTSFTLNISRLSRNGLFAIQNVLSRSNLERLRVLCSRVDPTLSGSIAQALASVQWSTLKALELSGDHIDVWIRLLMTYTDQDAIGFAHSDLSLQSLHVQGKGPVPQELSHASTLVVHWLLCTSPLQKLCLEKVKLQDSRDWIPLLEGIDYTLL